MTDKLLPVGAIFLGLAGVSLLAVQGFAPPVLVPRVPGAAPPPPPPPAAVDAQWEQLSSETPPPTPGEWPCFNGPDRDNINKEKVPLAKGWPEGKGPKPLWQVDLGEGYASASVHNGRVYVLDYDQKREGDLLRCFAFADGTELWRVFYKNPVQRYHGMSRGNPAVTDKYVVTMGPKCHVLCVDALTGKPVWSKNLVTEFQSTVPDWWSAQSPFIDGDKVILAPAGNHWGVDENTKKKKILPPTGKEVLLMALDLATGKVVWQTPHPETWQMSHCSLITITFKGQRQYVYFAHQGLAGFSMDGKILWQTNAWKVPMATVATPVEAAEGYLFLTGGYGAGAALLHLKDENGKITPEIVYKLSAKECGSEQQTPIFYKGYIYCAVPPSEVGELVCLEPLTGKRVWSSGKKNGFGLGPYLLADDVFYVVNNRGVLSLVKATPESFQQLWRGPVLEGNESYGPLTLAGGRLFVRNLKRMVCLDVSPH